jgi:hypothetical protein
MGFYGRDFQAFLSWKSPKHGIVSSRACREETKQNRDENGDMRIFVFNLYLFLFVFILLGEIFQEFRLFFTLMRVFCGEISLYENAHIACRG